MTTTTATTPTPRDVHDQPRRQRGAVRWETVGPFRHLTADYLATLPQGYALTLRLPNGTNLSVEKQLNTWTVRHHTWSDSHLIGLRGAERLPRPEAQEMKRARREERASR